MPLVNAKCTNCGANLNVDSTKDAAVCSYCGSAYIVEKAIKNYNITNNIRAGVVNVFGGNSADFVIRAGKLEKYTGASVDVVIPNSVVEIGSSAFDYCNNLTSVVIPSSVKTIGGSAFYDCTGLKTVKISEGVKEISRSAFRDCTGLTSLTIPSSVETIGESAFWGCTGLTSITIPDSVTYIGDFVFFGCSNLSSVTISQKLLDSLVEVHSNFIHCSAFSDTPFMTTIEKMYQGKLEEIRIKERKCPKCGGSKFKLFSGKCEECGHKKPW